MLALYQICYFDLSFSRLLYLMIIADMSNTTDTQKKFLPLLKQRDIAVER